MSSPIHQRDLSPLTSLRFFAALWVIFFHNFYLLGDSYSQSSFVHEVVIHGYLAVNFFFVLSGFILIQAYQKTFSIGFNLNDRQTFWLKRFARIYPVYVLGIILDVPRVVTFFIQNDGIQLGSLKIFASGLLHLMLIQSWIPRVTASWNPPGWSLSVEMFFYFLFPWLGAWIWSKKSSTLPALMMSVYMLGLGMTFFFVWPVDALKIGGPLATFAQDVPVLHLSEFCFGLILGKIDIENSRSDSSILILMARKWGFIISLFILFVVIRFADQIYPLFLSNGLLTPLFALLIFSAAGTQSMGTRILRAPGLVLLGQVSYAMYVIHQPIKGYLIWLAERLSWVHSPAAFFFYLIGVIFFSVVIFYCVEEPLKKRILMNLKIF